ncbi:hypothetical protein NG895_21855 [Aeoliella sp. ICT_H6.2]|uniref:TIGR04255 family protein n=1 Tax=Aeoliella straminimaris TaxID=2954799 RepID=A0A9X2FHW0_9BACT|nr:hypothetical protein [Aeoliella straminimaris]MCO6046551.1 hypothetical protein [Aeoliella straminimaris]
MFSYPSLADDHYSTLTLSTEMELAGTRDSVLFYVEQMQKKYPDMRNFYARNKRDFVLEGDKDNGQYRWSAVEPRRVSSGCVNFESYADAIDQHHSALELAPHALSVSPLDCEAIDLLAGFDFTYRGNHNELVNEALGLCPAFERLAAMPGTSFINNEPNITIAMDDDCRVQCRVSIETRTSPYHVRTGEFQEDQLSVYVTARRYGSLDPGKTFGDALDELDRICREIIEDHVAPSVLEPLARTIAMG